MCETTSDWLGTYIRRSAAIGNYEKYRTLFNKYHDGDIKAGEDLTNCGFKLLPSVFWGLPLIHQADLPKPDILHVVYLGIFETHLMKWIIGFLKKYKRMQTLDTV